MPLAAVRVGHELPVRKKIVPSSLDIPVAALSETFPEALSRRNVRTAALGWPLSAFETREGMTFLPALILAAEWSLVGGRLQVRPGSAA